MGFFDKFKQLGDAIARGFAHPNNTTTPVNELPAPTPGTIVNGEPVPQPASYIEPGQVQQTQPVYQATMPSQVFDRQDELAKRQLPDLGNTLADLWNSEHEPEYRNTQGRGRDGVVSVDDVELAPAFEARNTGGYNPSNSPYGILDSLGNGGIVEPENEDSLFQGVDIEAENRPTSETNAAYESLFNEQGYTGEPQNDRAIPHLFQALGSAGQLAQYDVPNAPQNRDLVNQSGQNAIEETSQFLTAAQKNAVDDGTLDLKNLNSNYMTGERYAEYIDAGIPNTLTPEQVEDIRNHPNTIYSKRNEMFENGFVPYVPSDEVYARQIVDNAMDQPTRWGGWLRDLRNDNLDYKVTYDGEEYSGKEYGGPMFDYWNETVPQVQELFDQMESGEEVTSPLADRDADHSNSTGYRMPIISNISLDDGSQISIDLYGATDNFDTIYQDPDRNIFVDENGNPKQAELYLSNGETLYLDGPSDLDEINNNIVQDSQPVPTDNDDEAEFWIPNYVTKDGEVVPWETMRALYGRDNEGNLNPEVNFDYGKWNIAKPASEIDGFLQTDEQGNTIFMPNGKDVLPATLDMFASSLPYFFLPTSIPYGLSQAHVAAATADPMSVNEQGQYNPLSSEINNNRYATSVMSNAAMPFTELGFGSIGGGALRAPFKAGTGWISNKYGRRAWMPFVQNQLGAVGEGVEEIYGNAVEEGTRQGLDTWYGDPLKSHEISPEELAENGWTTSFNGDVIDPITGVVVKDPNTPWPKRMINFAKDIPEAFASGWWLGELMSFPGIRKRFIDARKTYKDNKANREAGYRDPFSYRGDSNDEVAPLDDRVLDYLYGEE